MSLKDRFIRGVNAFMNKDPTSMRYGSGYSYRPDRVRFRRGNERSIINTIFTRIAIDCAAIDIKHVYLDENGRYLDDVDSGLNHCLTVEANIDQDYRAFMQDVVMSLFDEGVICVFPYRTEVSILTNEAFDVYAMRTAKIVEWYPRHVRIRCYNDETGIEEELTVPKQSVAIIENPFYNITNQPNSTLQRMIRKLNLLDYIDNEVSSGKVNMIIQLPYQVKSDARRAEAKRRTEDVSEQLKTNEFGIAYIDGTEKITQLNRPLDNTLVEQVNNLQELLFAQFGITQDVLDGTANEQTMLNYNNRTIEPIISAIVNEFRRKFLTKTARNRSAYKQDIKFFRDPFRLVPISNIADIADRFTRNEILTPNEVRQIVGMPPSGDDQSDVLRNRNISMSDMQMQNGMTDEYGNQIQGSGNMEEIQNGQ